MKKDFKDTLKNYGQAKELEEITYPLVLRVISYCSDLIEEKNNQRLKTKAAMCARHIIDNYIDVLKRYNKIKEEIILPEQEYLFKKINENERNILNAITYLKNLEERLTK